MNGLRGEQAEPALRAMLERLYEDATSFGFPEERFDRVYGEVELTLYRDAVRARVIAPLHGRVDGRRAHRAGRRPVARARRRPRRAARALVTLLCVLERDVPADDPIPAEEAAERFAAVVTAMRLWSPGGVVLGAPGWRQAEHARWQPVAIGAAASARGAEWMLPAGDEQAFREFFTAIAERAADRRGRLGARPLRDGLRAPDRRGGAVRLPARAARPARRHRATRDGRASACAWRRCARRRAARRELQHRLEAAVALERFVMGGAGGVRLDAESPRELVAEVEGHLRALLRDVLCGYLDADLKAVADDILVESGGEPLQGDRGARPAPGCRGAGRRSAEPEPHPAREPRFEREPAAEPVTFEPELE